MNTNNTYSFENLSIDDLRTVMSKIYKGSSQKEVSQATEYLLAFGSTLQSVPVFVQLLTQDSVLEIRLLAAVLLKKHIGPHLANMSTEDRQAIQNGMLSRFFEEPVKKIKRTLAALISVMMKKSFELEQSWTEPLVALSEKIKPTQPEETRLEGFLLLSTILDFTGEHLPAFYEDLLKFFYESMNDNSAIIRKQTMLCVLNMYTSVSEVILIESFGHIYPKILECFYQSLQEEDEDTIEKFFEMLSALTQERNDIFDNSKLTKLIEIFCTDKGLLSKTLNPLYIEAMIDILQNIVLKFKSVITKSETMLRKIIEIIFTLACRKEPKEDLQDRESIQEVALIFIGQASQYLPKKKSYPIFKEYLVKMFGSGNDEVIEGAFLILGELAEGSVEYLKRDLPTIMKSFIQKGLESTVPDIKQATFHAINMFASYLSPDVMVYHPMIIPVLIKNLDMSDQKGLLSNVRALVLFCDEMADSIMGYIPELIPRLINAIDKAENSISVKSTAISAIASCAEAAEDKFAQYASELLPLLAQLINITDKDYIDIKSNAIKCIGLIIGHCLKNNPDIISGSIDALIGTVYDTFKSTENTQLKENCFIFFYSVAMFMGANFKPYLEKIIELVFSTVENQQRLQEAGKPKVISLDSDSEDDNDPNNFWVDENVVEELAAAICCLGEMALACPAEYAPYYEKTVAVLSSLAKFFHYMVRIQVLKCYKNLAFAIIKLGNGGEIPKFTAGLPCGKRFSEDAEKFLYGEVYDKLLNTFQTDEHIQLLITATEILQEFCMELGPAAVDGKLDEIVKHLLNIFNNDTNAQNQAYEDEEEVHAELFGSTTLVVDLLIKTCRDGFISYFDTLYPELKKFALNQDISEDDVAEVIGCFAQAAKYMPSAAQIYGLDMLEVCVKTLDLGDEIINNNVAYCMGLIVESGKEKIYDHYRTIMEKLRVIFENSTLPDTRDNAISSLSRMVYTNPSLVPLNVVLPTLLNEMPLKGDYKEHRSCVKMLIFLLETDPAALSGLEGKCVELLVDAIVERKKYKIKDENMIKAIGLILKNLSANENGKEMIQGCASKLSQENVEILTQLLNAQY